GRGNCVFLSHAPPVQDGPHRSSRRGRGSARCAGPGRSTTVRPDASARRSPHEWGRHCAGDPGPAKAGTAASRSRSFSHRARVVVSCAVRSHSRSSPVEVWCSGDRHCWSKTPLSLGGCIAGSEKSFSGVHERERSSTLGTGGEWTLGDRKSTRLNSSHVSISYAV